MFGQTLLQPTWEGEAALEPPTATIAPIRAGTPTRSNQPPLPSAPSAAAAAEDDNDASPIAATGETNWESMKPRDKAGDEVVRRTEASLPKWRGPTLDAGWFTLSGAVSIRPRSQSCRGTVPARSSFIHRLTTALYYRMPRTLTTNTPRYWTASRASRTPARKHYVHNFVLSSSSFICAVLATLTLRKL